jgi:signal transduction histidine kinase/CheY-like chemotaxis protein
MTRPGPRRPELEVEALRRELEETSRGLLVLHAELLAQQEELQRAREAAEAASRAKAAFLANMSHELRSPMTAVVGFTSLLLETGLTAEQVEYAQAVQAAGSHLLGVIDDILDLSKIESGTVELEEVPFDLYACVEDAVAILAPKAAEKGLPLVALFGPDLPRTIVGDPLRLRQILVNLLANAVKFTQTGSVTLSVDRVGAADLELRVTDTGIGIAAADTERLFAAFTQAEADTTRKHGGTGLGLSICRQLADQMGGGVSVRSKLGAGSTFTCLVPDRLTAPAAADPVLAGTRVLVVHGEPLVTESLRRHLTGWGATVFTRPGSADPDLAIVAGDLREATLGLGPGVPVVCTRAITAHPDSRRPTVSIPVRRDRLRAAILTALGRPTGTPAASAAQPPAPSPAPSPTAPPAAPPASREALSANLAQVLAAIPNHPATTPAPRCDVLYVDDDSMTTDLVLRILGQEPGLTLRVAPDGATALSLAAQHPPDLVLLDLHLPDMDGDTLLLRLHGDPRLAAVPVWVLSGDASPDTRQRLVNLGARGYLPKPFRPAQLRALVSTAR